MQMICFVKKNIDIKVGSRLSLEWQQSLGDANGEAHTQGFFFPWKFCRSESLGASALGS
jgi:hypothetical protein